MTAALPLPTLVAALADRYTLDRELGRGGTAAVYLALDRKHQRQVAIKVLRPEVAAHLGAERFLREIAIAARLTHPHILPLIDSGEAAGSLYYVMPYVPGESLRQRLERERRLPVRDALRAARDVGAALDYAHRQVFLPRDIKPENVLLADGHALVAHFGLATLARHVTERPRPVRSLRPEAPAAVEHAIARALAKNPADRFPTVAAFIAALDAGTGPDAAPAALGIARSLAVLPFENTSPDPETDYLSDGITDELINALTKVNGLRVASRTSVFALKGKPQDVRAIGALLGVSAVLEGTVRKAGDRLRITARLTAADDGRHLWSERYDRKLDDVFAIQDEIAGTIVSTLRTTFLAEVADPTPKRYTESVIAYGLYLKGRYCWNMRSREGARDAIRYFEQAIAADPRYALAYSGLSDAYALQVDYRGVPVAEGLTRARVYARQALALDDSLAEAHTSLGWVLFIYDWDWDGGAQAFRRAVELNPGYATAHQWYSFILAALGQLDR